MSNPVTGALDRLVAIQLEMTTILEPNLTIPIDAKPYGFFTQESFPYWTNRVLSYTAQNQSQEFFVYTYRIQMRFIRGWATEGLTGEIETALYTDIPNISTYFAARTRLQSTAYPDPLIDLDPRGAYITEMLALPNMLSDGIGQQVMGSEFVIEVPLEIQVEQVDYLH